jgi:hypothetical protein
MNAKAVSHQESRGPVWVNAGFVLVWLAAGVLVFLPFAFHTSPWDAVRFQVPAIRETGGICSLAHHSFSPFP